MNIQAPFTFASVHPLGVCLALVHQARAALVFVVRGLCGHFRFCALGLTRRSSRPAYCGRLILFVSTEENQFISPMLIQTAFNFSSAVQRWVCRLSGLRLLVLRHFPAFLASSPFVASASSYCFRSAAQPRWRCAFSQFVPVAKFKLPVLASGSNLPVKPTRILRSAYLAR